MTRLSVIAAVLLAHACSGTTAPEPELTPREPEPASSSVDSPSATQPAEKPKPEPAEPPKDEVVPQARTLTFEWCPSGRVSDAYEMTNEEDRHRVVLTPGVAKGGTYPVVVAFHGQPKRGRNPRDYWFPGPVVEQVVAMVEAGEIQPVILVVPVFRYVGGNWPWMNPWKLRQKVGELLKEEEIETGDWYAFGHSGAAGCGGGGLNQAHLMKPSAVGFFDTCLGKDWVEELANLQKAGVKTVNIHSVETAAFRPRQRPEYQSTFDFGRAYGPAGMKPISCPEVHPGDRLRDQKYRCAASKDGVIKGFVVDSGEGVEAHKAIVQIAVRYFLINFADLSPE